MKKIEVDSSSTSSDVDPVQLNAFQVLLMNQRALSSKSTLPARLEPRNNKDKLFNDLVLLTLTDHWLKRDLKICFFCIILLTFSVIVFFRVLNLSVYIVEV